MKALIRITTGMFIPLFLFLSCTSPKEKIPDSALKQTGSNKVIIYQMMTRLFGNKNSTNKVYGTIEENGVGKFEDINTTALKAIKELGVTHVWYSGIIEHALVADYTSYGIAQDDADVVKGRAGSPFAIKDYYDVNPDLAKDVKNRMKEFEDLVERTHHEGMKVIIDFVPNHVARAYASDSRPEGIKDLGESDDKTVTFKASNNFYYLPSKSFQVPKGYNALGENQHPTKDKTFKETPAKVTGNNQFTEAPAESDWFETVKLNYGVDFQNAKQKQFDPIPDTWVKMRDILVFWAEKKVDGFRCDMVEMVPVEFWAWAIPAVRAVNANVIFIAEIYNPSQYKDYIEKGHFDFLYDKVQLYDSLRRLTRGKGDTRSIAQVQKSLEGMNHNMIHFMENHDEQRIASSFFAADAWKGVPGMTISSLVDQGPVMIYFGQEVGESGSGKEGYGGEDGRTTIFDYWGVPNHQKWMNGGKFDLENLGTDERQLRQFYQDILTLSATNPAISHGAYFDLTEKNREWKNIPGNVHVFARVYGEEKLLIVSGFNSEKTRIKLKLTEEVVKELGMNSSSRFIGRDLLRSGAEIGFDESYQTEIDVAPFSAYVFKIK